MKILFYNHTGQVSGAERVLLLVLAGLNRTTFTAEVICPSAGPLKDEVIKLDLPQNEIDGLSARFTLRPDRLFGYLISFIRLMRQLRGQVRKGSPELIHANSVRAGIVATIATTGLAVKVIWHVHDLLPKHPLSTAIRVVFLCSRRTNVIAISNAVSRNFRGRLLKDNESVTVIMNAIDLEKFQPDREGGESVRKELGFIASEPVIGIVGQITPRKGQRQLLEAFSLVVKLLPQAKLLIVGAPLFNNDAEYLNSLHKVVEEQCLAAAVSFLGAREDVPSIMNALDILVVNSLAEPFGLVVAEGMACGIPVLATAVDGIPEIITHGEDGYLVLPRDKQKLASAIVHLLKDSSTRSEMTTRGLEKVRREFSAERYMREVQALFLRAGRLKVGSEDIAHPSMDFGA